MDTENVSPQRVRVAVYRSASHDEDGRVDKQGKSEEGNGEFDDRVLETVAYGGVRGDVDNLVVALVG